MGYTYTKKLFVHYLSLEFKFNWMFCVFHLLNLATVLRALLQHVKMKHVGQSSADLSLSALKRKAGQLSLGLGGCALMLQVWPLSSLCWNPPKLLNSTYCSFRKVFAAQSSSTRYTLYYKWSTEFDHQRSDDNWWTLFVLLLDTKESLLD